MKPKKQRGKLSKEALALFRVIILADPTAREVQRALAMDDDRYVDAMMTLVEQGFMRFVYDAETDTYTREILVKGFCGNQRKHYGRSMQERRHDWED